MDLRGLAALFGKINSLLDERQSLAAEDSLDLFGLSKFLQRRGANKRAQSTCAQASTRVCRRNSGRARREDSR